MSQPALEEQFEPGAGDTVEAARARSSWELFRHRFRQDKAAMAGAVILVILVVLALAAPLFARLVGHGPNELFADEMLTPDIGLPKGPNAQFWFGGDSVGRDVFVRTLYGARTSLTVALVATGLAALLGVSLGMIAGYRGGKTDTFISRLIDIVLSMPVLLLAIGLASVCSISANGCLGGAAPARPDPGHRHHRPVHLAQHGPPGPRPGAHPAREGVRRGRPLAGRPRLLASCSRSCSPTCWRRSSSTRPC